MYRFAVPRTPRLVAQLLSYDQPKQAFAHASALMQELMEDGRLRGVSFESEARVMVILVDIDTGDSGWPPAPNAVAASAPLVMQPVV